MAKKARHAYGSRNDVISAIQDGRIDSYDVLFLSGEDESPTIGWVDKDGNPIIVETDLSEVTSELATKADADEVNAKFDEVAQSTVSSANAYTDEKLKDVLGEHFANKYEISHKPVGTLVNYRDKEIRVMCPANTQWTKQSVGATGNANMYYMGFKAYAPTNAMSFKEDDQATIVDQTMYYFEDNDFAGVDENGRKYSIVWLALASYDEATDTWSYFGEKSTVAKYIGWHYSVEWYDATGMMIASDCIRINLTNESCHSSVEPYYVSGLAEEIKAYTDSQIETRIEEVSGAFEVVEF